MKFNLFTLSAIALCLLQQIQANVQPQTGSELTSTSVQNGPGEKSQTLKAPATSGETTATAGEPNSALGLVGLRKRDGLDDLVENLLGGVLKLNGGDNILKGLDIANLGDLINDLLKSVKGLLGDDGLLKTVSNLLKEVVKVVEDLLKEILGLLGVADVDGLELKDLIEKVEGILGESDNLDLLNGEVLDLTVIQNLLQTVQGLLGGAGDDELAGGILKNVLDIVSNLLEGLGLDDVLGGVTPDKRSILRRALVKRAIARRAAI